ncbi:hypothetical protein [Streptomyces maremycinicus]|uniref:hypothetical protein n=1 Tax=Streptomyces maremycinicus TaxID=1679753 RepID=UPI000AC6C035|nr:hypothetical protein [Streptomyces sp. NBRC 110468]
MTLLVDKPSPKNALSAYAVIGQFVACDTGDKADHCVWWSGRPTNARISAPTSSPG